MCLSYNSMWRPQPPTEHWPCKRLSPRQPPSGGLQSLSCEASTAFCSAVRTCTAFNMLLCPLACQGLHKACPQTLCTRACVSWQQVCCCRRAEVPSVQPAHCARPAAAANVHRAQRPERVGEGLGRPAHQCAPGRGQLDNLCRLHSPVRLPSPLVYRQDWFRLYASDSSPPHISF